MPVMENASAVVATLAEDPSGAPLTLLDLPLDCLMLVMEMLSPWSLKQFGVASRRAQAIADRWFSDVRYGRELARRAFDTMAECKTYPEVLSSARLRERWGIKVGPVAEGLRPDYYIPLDSPAAPGDIRMNRRLLSQTTEEDVIWLNYRLGLSNLTCVNYELNWSYRLCREQCADAGEVLTLSAARYLLEWSATFERGGLRGDSRPRRPRAEILALLRYRKGPAGEGDDEKEDDTIDHDTWSRLLRGRRTDIAIALMGAAGTWGAGRAAARACLKFASSPPSSSNDGMARWVVADMFAKVLSLGRPFISKQVTPDRAVLIYAMWFFMFMCGAGEDLEISASPFTLQGPDNWFTKTRTAFFSYGYYWGNYRERFRFPRKFFISLPVSGQVPGMDDEADDDG